MSSALSPIHLIIQKDNFPSEEWHFSLPFTVTGILLDCSWAAQASCSLHMTHSYLIPQLQSSDFSEWLPSSPSPFSSRDFTELKCLFSVILFCHVIYTSSGTSMPRPFWAPHQVPSHLNVFSLILTQASHWQLYHLFSLSPLVLYLKKIQVWAMPPPVSFFNQSRH